MRPSGKPGATGYIAALGLSGFPPEIIRPAALALNTLVAAIGTARFAQSRPHHMATHVSVHPSWIAFLDPRRSDALSRPRFITLSSGYYSSSLPGRWCDRRARPRRPTNSRPRNRLYCRLSSRVPSSALWPASPASAAASSSRRWSSRCIGSIPAMRQDLSALFNLLNSAAALAGLWSTSLDFPR